LELLSRSGPKPTDRTTQLLRRFDLERDANEALTALQQEIAREPTPEKVYAFAELAYIRGKKSDLMGDKEAALSFYGAAVAHAYLYLFDPRFDAIRNHYDPQFRGACDLYNVSLEGSLRIANKGGMLKPGTTQQIHVGGEPYTVQVVMHGSAWHDDDFESLEFASDYEIQGLNNRHHTFGLGVPLIAVRKRHENASAAEQFYPPGLSFPVTAFLRVHHVDENAGKHCLLELHDPRAANAIQIGQRIVPLETDMSTALGYFLDHPALQETKSVATLGLLNPNSTEQLSGLYMLEPYDPQRIPVIMVHGLWSSPLTWMEMFNDLRSFPEIRRRYQFWFYLYPTGQPFWHSATRFREDLAAARRKLDVNARNPHLDQMVLVGHSMGGLVSRLQVIDSGDQFWRIVSDQPFSDLSADDETRRELASSFFFRPNPSVRRVVTLGTPHRGSEFANDYTRWLGRKLITLPTMLVQQNQRVIRDNSDVFRNTEFLTITTSIDSLAPDSPILPVMLESQRAPWVRHHNIVGVVPQDGWIGSFAGEGDGVVSFASAHLDYVESEVIVPADHVTVHQHPRAILEVRRILLDHLLDMDAELARRNQPTRQAAFPGPPARVGGQPRIAP
ncbi:MAG: alpha/beta fold hydrolase, partial [Pirellulaceae bacterium]|nr:alpha/beta fold hydrolase [Pirellulaceae bacterium]